MIVDSRVSLTEFWANFNFDRPPYIHPEDQTAGQLNERDFLKDVTDLKTFAQSNYYGEKSNLIHSHLLPSPFAGDLGKGDIFILMLNPGFSVGDYYGERQQRFRRALQATLNQNLYDEEFPFIWLNPELSFHPGFVWWSGKLESLIVSLRKKWGVTYFEASKRLSHRLCGLELFPYHSQSFEDKHVNKQLPSLQIMQSYAKTLATRAQAGKVQIIVTRRAKEWGLPKCDNICTLSSGQARAAHLTPNTQAGKAIESFIERNPRE